MRTILPTKSKEIYQKTYDKFQVWRGQAHLLGRTNEKEVFAYLHQMLTSGKWNSPGPLWSKFSMISSVLLTQESLDIKGTYMNGRIHIWLKRMSAGHKAKKRTS